MNKVGFEFHICFMKIVLRLIFVTLKEVLKMTSVILAVKKKEILVSSS